MIQIEIKELYKIYNENKKNSFTALEDINITINKAQTIILKGISGSGKSTLLSLIAGMSKPTRGSIIVNKQAISKLPDIHISKFRNKVLGFIFQSFNLFEHLNVRDNISLPLVHLGEDVKDIENKTIKSANLANIIHKIDENIQNLSGGEKQRVAIARALVNNPDIILCDEPTANLDNNNSLKFIEILKELKMLGKTIIIATHDPIFDDIDIVDKVINISNGKISKGEKKYGE